jgi:hypothetical protein
MTGENPVFSDLGGNIWNDEMEGSKPDNLADDMCRK